MCNIVSKSNSVEINVKIGCPSWDDSWHKYSWESISLHVFKVFALLSVYSLLLPPNWNWTFDITGFPLASNTLVPVLNSAQECHQMEDLDRKSSHPSKSSHFNHNILTDPTSTFTDEKTYNKIYNLELLQKIGPTCENAISK